MPQDLAIEIDELLGQKAGDVHDGQVSLPTEPLSAECLVGPAFFPTSDPHVASSAVSENVSSMSSEHKYYFAIKDGVIQLRAHERWRVVASCKVQGDLPQTVVGLIRSAMRGAYEAGRIAAMADVRKLIGVKDDNG